MHATQLPSPTVLVVDDDGDLCSALADCFAMAGAECVCVRSVAELVSRGAEALACRLALLDVNLGAGQPSGIDAYEWLRHRRFAGRTVFLTGHAASHPLVARVRAVSRSAVLTKPVELDTLLGLLEERS